MSVYVYGSGNVKGTFAKETVMIGNDIVVENQWFAQVTNAGGLGKSYSMGKFDDILGLGFGTLSVGGSKTVCENAVKQNKFQKSMFSFYLGDMTRSTESELMFVGYDSRRFEGDISWHALSHAAYWQIKTSDLSMDCAIFLLLAMRTMSMDWVIFFLLEIRTSDLSMDWVIFFCWRLGRCRCH